MAFLSSFEPFDPQKHRPNFFDPKLIDFLIAELGLNLRISAQLGFLPIRIGKLSHEVALLSPGTDRPSHSPTDRPTDSLSWIQQIISPLSH